MAERCGYLLAYDCRCDGVHCVILQAPPGTYPFRLTPSADLPACRDEDPAQAATLAVCYPGPPEYPHPEEPPDADR